MQSLIYEYLMCAAYETERHGARGKVDADVYRDMERSLREVELQKDAIKKREMPASTKSIDQLEYEAKAATVKVRENVYDAINEALKRTKLRHASEDTLKRLKGLQSKLSLDEYDKKVIDNVISEVWKVFRENQLA